MWRVTCVVSDVPNYFVSAPSILAKELGRGIILSTVLPDIRDRCLTETKYTT
jgi:hypothetical protein